MKQKLKKKYLIKNYKKDLEFAIKGFCVVSILYTPFCMYDRTLLSIYSLVITITIFSLAIGGIIALINQKKVSKNSKETNQ